MKYLVLDLSDNTQHLWSVEQMVAEVNRDRSEGWEDYTISDWKNGWFEFVEGISHKCMGCVGYGGKI